MSKNKKISNVSQDKRIFRMTARKTNVKNLQRKYARGGVRF